MELSEFSYEFDVLYNNITSNQAPGLDEYEKSVFLTKAQDEIVKSYFDPRLNKPLEGFDLSERRLIDFSMIMRSKAYHNYLVKVNKVPEEFSDDVSEISPKDLNEMSLGAEIIEVPLYELLIEGEEYQFLKELSHLNFYIIEDSAIIGFVILYTVFEDSFFDMRDNTESIPLEKDILMFVNEYVEVKRSDSATPVRLTVLPINHIEYSRLMSKPFQRPLRNQAWRLLDNSDNNKKAEIVVGPNDSLLKYAIRYVKRPRAIITRPLEGVTLDGYVGAKEDGTPTKITSEAKKGISCELDPILHPEILQRAVELAKAAYIGDLLSQIALGSTSQTNIGVVPQSR